MLGGVLFGAIHMDLRGLPVRALLGVLLGWMVWRGRSIYPAMLAHGLFDSTSVALFAWALKRVGPEKIAAAAEAPGMHLETSDTVALSAGAALVLIGAILFRTGVRRPVMQASPAGDFPVATPADSIPTAPRPPSPLVGEGGGEG